MKWSHSLQRLPSGPGPKMRTHGLGSGWCDSVSRSQACSGSFKGIFTIFLIERELRAVVARTRPVHPDLGADNLAGVGDALGGGAVGHGMGGGNVHGGGGEDGVLVGPQEDEVPLV